MGHLAVSKKRNMPHSVLHYAITFAQILTLFKPPSQNWGRKPNIPPALEKKLVDYLLVIERKYFGYTLDDVKRLSFQLAVQNKFSNPFSIAKEAAGKDWLKRFMKLHSDKLSLRPPTGTSAARATGFSKEQVWILFDLYVNQQEHPLPEPQN